jgi:hypothetical protein
MWLLLRIALALCGSLGAVVGGLALMVVLFMIFSGDDLTHPLSRIILMAGAGLILVLTLAAIIAIWMFALRWGRTS